MKYVCDGCADEVERDGLPILMRTTADAGSNTRYSAELCEACEARVVTFINDGCEAGSYTPPGTDWADVAIAVMCPLVIIVLIVCGCIAAVLKGAP